MTDKRATYMRAYNEARRNDPSYRAKRRMWYVRWMAAHPNYLAYNNAQRRCTETSNREYLRYGGRGIRFCFTSYGQFMAALGPKPEGYTLDRINNDGNYEPGNVRWASRSQQAYNRRPKSTMATSSKSFYASVIDTPEGVVVKGSM